MTDLYEGALERKSEVPHVPPSELVGETSPTVDAFKPDIPLIDNLVDSELKLDDKIIKSAYESSLQRAVGICTNPNLDSDLDEAIHSVSDPLEYTSPEGTVCEFRLSLRGVTSARLGSYDMVGVLVRFNGNDKKLPLVELGPLSVIARPHSNSGERRDGAPDLQSLLAAMQAFDGIHVNIRDLVTNDEEASSDDVVNSAA